MNNGEKKENSPVEDIKVHIQKCNFPGLHHLNITTSTQLAHELNPMFYNVFSDYSGMTITMDQAVKNGALYANLFFLPGSTHDTATSACVSAVQQINQVDKKANLVERQMAMSRISRDSRNYRLTDQTRRFLARFICNFKINHVNQPKPLVDRVRWNEIEIETVDQVQQGFWAQQNNSKTYLVLKYVSLEKLLAEIYGDKNENGKPIQYQVTVAAQMPSYGGIPQNNKLLSVACIDVEMLEKVVDNLGYRSAISNLGIIH